MAVRLRHQLHQSHLACCLVRDCIVYAGSNLPGRPVSARADRRVHREELTGLKSTDYSVRSTPYRSTVSAKSLSLWAMKLRKRRFESTRPRSQPRNVLLDSLFQYPCGRTLTVERFHFPSRAHGQANDWDLPLPPCHQAEETNGE
ncbi:hypothetical protein CIHG_07743 [Coccidioides immitis H538.4]|uniref:Uncharacterized protein n=2 Tax=Coccidioides immitis TaxID=5501 RepID=A0A0J8S129_COCIT|nr:hypothetical protein CIRG_04217 [Coccidioides immitis RMSCC 2394]KMU90059.1 hypothetical protein CIHG_07743 [Coccidioides immitis H538.4]